MLVLCTALYEGCLVRCSVLKHVLNRYVLLEICLLVFQGVESLSCPDLCAPAVVFDSDHFDHATRQVFTASERLQISATEECIQAVHDIVLSIRSHGHVCDVRTFWCFKYTRSSIFDLLILRNGAIFDSLWILVFVLRP